MKWLRSRDWILVIIAIFVAALVTIVIYPAKADEAHYQAELTCLAQTIYYEGRSEPDEGRAAIGQVVINRVLHPRFPNTICGVVKQGGEDALHKCQFSWYCDGKPDNPYNPEAWAFALELAESFMQGNVFPPARGALHYHAEYVNPTWADNLQFIGKFGVHLFYGQERGITA